MEDVSEKPYLTNAEQMELQVYGVLKQVLDPEIGLNIIDMGLVYTIDYDLKNGIKIEMTLTSKGCPLGESIIAEVKKTLEQSFPGIPAEVILVWQPAWTMKNITSSGLEQLGH